MSISGGYLAMVKDALSIDASAMQFFSRNPRGSTIRPLDMKDINAAKTLLSEADIRTDNIIAHAPYTYNPCSANPDIREFTRKCMREDIERFEVFPGILYNFHPGSHTGQGTEAGVILIAQCLAEIMTPGQKTVVLMETMSGKGSEVGKTFEEIRAVIDLAETINPDIKNKIGVCLDTCHVHDAGYDIVNNLDGVIAHFNEAVGIERLRAIHLNDSKNIMGSSKDRHAKIGDGYIGTDAIARVINHPKLRGLTFCLETPNDIEGYRGEIAVLRG